MNTLYSILFVILTYTNDVQSDSIGPLSVRSYASYCYHCTNCPLPFNPYSSLLTITPTNTGWCATMSNSSTPDAVATRFVAQPSVCNYLGCHWKIIGGTFMYVCCCNSNLCNGDSQMITTIRPYTNRCYYCSNCPIPFTHYDGAVSEVYSTTGWCAKIGSSSSIYDIYTRDSAEPGLCSSNGCTWQIVRGVYTYVCCCSGYLCNTAVSTSASIVAVLSTLLITTVVACKCFS